jgi:TonB-linked SusC/RagA family outer membrane protein
MEQKLSKGYLTFYFLFMLLITTVGAQAQMKVSGKVFDNHGETIPGVTVLIKGTTNGTITDSDGAYQIEVNSGATLVFSYIGMQTESIEITDQTTLNVTLQPDVIGVDEVVVVGYGTKTKEELTGAVSSVSSSQLKVSNESNVIGRLQGQVSGVTITSANTPGGSATIRIRGIGTINDANPLYIIDGVPAAPGNNISPGDIESISVLKDASSAAIYGTRGANGVVIITTKRGHINQQPNINFSIRTGISKAVNQYDMLNTNEYADAVWLSFKNRGVAPVHAQYGSGSTPVIPDYILPAGAMEGDPATDPALYNYPSYVIFKANKEGTDWYDEIYRNAFVQEYNLSVSGGSKKATYAFSGNYLDEDGILINTNFKRYTFRMNSDAKFKSWLKVGESLQAVYTEQKGNMSNDSEGSPISFAYRAQPIIPVYDIMGHFAGSRAPEMGNTKNPVAMLDRSKNNIGKWARVIGNIYGEITFFKGLTAKTLFGYNYGQWNSKSYILPSYEDSEPNKTNGLNVGSSHSFQWNWSNTLNYNATFGGKHRLNVILGTEAIENYWEYMNASRRSYFAETPEYMQLSSGESNKENSGNASEWSLFSIFGRVNYDLKGKYFIEATVRRDGSSRFSAANRYGTFPAASAAWAISEEDFMSGTRSWLDLLKLRLGWGIAGNDGIGNYNSYTTYNADPYKSSYAIDGSNTQATSGFKPLALGNEDVTWETTNTINIGIDANMFDNSLTFSLDLWKRNTSDMLFMEPIPNVKGVVRAPFVNIGEMENKGFDIEVGYSNSSADGKFTYSAILTLSHYKNKIIKLSGDPDRTIDAGVNRQMVYTRFANGTEFPEFYGYVVEGIFQTQDEADAHPPYGTSNYNQPGHFKFKDVDDNGVIDPDDRTFIGSPHPDLTGGLNIDLGYANFDLTMFFYGSVGNKLVNYVNRWIDYGMFNGGLSNDALYKSWGSPYLDDNANATLPMLDQSDISQQPSTAFVEDASYLRMKTFQLGYTLPKSVLSNVFSKLRVYAQITNVFTLTGYSGLDPEYNSAGSGMGIDHGSWPTPRQFMFGVNLGL